MMGLVWIIGVFFTAYYVNSPEEWARMPWLRVFKEYLVGWPITLAVHMRSKEK